MSRAPEGIDPHTLNVEARRVLLDALQALTDHREAIVLIGAQAVNVHTEAARLDMPTYTSDGDLGITPGRLREYPLVEDAMKVAGFRLTKGADGQIRHGSWSKAVAVAGITGPYTIAVDLMVGHELSSGGRRAAHLPPHDPVSVRRVRGIEVAAVDHAPIALKAFDPADARIIDVNVAGVSALLIAKAFKISERRTDARRRPDRVEDKDAGDVLSLMAAATPDIADALHRLSGDARVGSVAREGVQLLRDLFGRPRAAGVNMAVQALQGTRTEGWVRDFAVSFIQSLHATGRPAPPKPAASE
jgi:hypothetical protein